VPHRVDHDRARSMPGIDASTGRTLAGVSVLVRWAEFKDNPNLREFERALSQFPVAGMPYELEH